MKEKQKIGMVSLGCTKNQVDAEMMLALIDQGGFEICGDPEQCDAIIINTCGFIEDAKRESIENILEFCRMKEEGKVKAVAVSYTHLSFPFNSAKACSTTVSVSGRGISTPSPTQKGRPKNSHSPRRYWRG